MSDRRTRIDAKRARLTPEQRALLDQRLARAGTPDAGASAGMSRTRLPAVVPDPASRHMPFPLADIQQAYWLGRQATFELGNIAEHIYVEVEQVGLDIGRFQSAWRSLVERHEMLRAIVLPEGTQRILPRVPDYEIEIEDLRGHDPDTADTRLMDIRERLSHQVLSVDEWPLFEIRATRLDNERSRIHLSIDGMVGDAWSLGILFRELAALYADPHARLEPLELSFRDYIMARERIKDSPLYEQARAYWQGRAASLPDAPQWPMVVEPDTMSAPRFRRREGRLDAAAWAKLQRRATRSGLTPTSVLLSAFADALGTWSQTHHFTVSVTQFERLPLHPQINQVVGDFSSFLLLEVDATSAARFEERASAIQRQMWADMEHPYMNGVEVLRELARVRGASSVTMPVVFTSLLNQDTTSGGLIGSLSSIGDIVTGVTQTSQIWLDHQVMVHDGELRFFWDSIDDLFPPGLLDQVFGAYCSFLEQLADHEQSWNQRPLALIPAAQVEQRARVNRTEREVPAGLLHRGLAANAAHRGDALAVVSAAGQLSYGELYRRANQLGNLLHDMGVRARARVAVVMDKGWPQIVAVCGILQAGAAYFPIDPRAPSRRLAELIEYGSVDAIVTEPHLDSQREWPADVPRLALDASSLRGIPDTIRAPAQSPEDIAVVICTSGSTGRPKGVMLTHTGCLNAVVDLDGRVHATSRDRAIAITALHHDMAAYDLFGMMETGGTLVIPDPACDRDPGHWAELVHRFGVTLWTSVPAFMQMLVEQAEARQLTTLGSLRRVLLGGDWIPVPLPDRIRALAPGCEVISIGGPTETSICSVIYPIGTVDPGWKSIPYGKPLGNQQLHVYNQALADCPTWVPGEICNAGIGLAAGYWQDEAETQARFLSHPVTSQRIYRTGDIGRYLPDGNIELLGRIDFQVKLQGQRIEPREIEGALERHTAIQSAVVVAKQVREHRHMLVAYFVAQPGASIEPAALRQHLEAALPPHMVPTAFVQLTEIPLTANGKVDRQALPDPVLAADDSFLAPRTQAEHDLAAIVARVLQHAPDGISVRANLFELGANSIHIIQILARARVEMGVEISVARLFDMPTIEGLARAVEEQAAAGAGQGPVLPPIRARQDPADYPLSFAQRRLWFLDMLEPGSPIFNINGFVRLRGELDVSALERSLQDVMQRHEVLRAVFHNDGGRPVQTLGAPQLAMEHVDLQDTSTGDGSSERDIELEIAQRCRADVRKPFDISAGPLVRHILLKFAADDHALITTTHHLVSDAWSLGLLIAELATFYRAHRLAATAEVSPLPIQYADYAAWEAQVLQGETLAEMLSYWKGSLEQAPLTLALPTDRPRAQAPAYEGAMYDVALAKDVTSELEELGRQQGATLFMALLATYAVLLGKSSGQERLVIGTPVANRNSPETENLLGCFVNMLPLSIDLQGDPSFRELLARVREVVVGAFSHQGLPFEKLVEVLQPERTRNTTPIFQVVLQLDNIPTPAIELPGLRLELGMVDWGTVRYDAALRLVKGAEGLTGAMNYRKSLWDERSIASMMDELVATMRWLVAHPDSAISGLEAGKWGKPARAAGPARRGPGGMKRKAINVNPRQLVGFAPFRSGAALPLVATPSTVDVDLPAWIARNRGAIDDKLFAHGAILFRGFGIDSVDEFRAFSHALSPSLDNYDERTSPRTALGDKIFSSTEYPADKIIHFHNANSYSHFWPMKIWFGCMIAAETGGQTPISDCHQVLSELDADIVRRFADKQVLYVRNFMPGVGLTWQETFQTGDRAVVAAYCRDAGIEHEWVSPEHLRTRQVRQAVATHPVTGKRVWFNQAHLFHISMLDEASAASFIDSFAREDLPVNSYYGDGSEIEADVLHAIIDAYDAASIRFPWQVGDVMLLDNMLVAHGREAFSGDRLITVAFSGRHFSGTGGAEDERRD